MLFVFIPVQAKDLPAAGPKGRVARRGTKRKIATRSRKSGGAPSSESEDGLEEPEYVEDDTDNERDKSARYTEFLLQCKLLKFPKGPFPLSDYNCESDVANN